VIYQTIARFRKKTFGHDQPKKWRRSTKHLAKIDQTTGRDRPNNLVAIDQTSGRNRPDSWPHSTREQAAIDQTTGRDGLSTSALGRWHYAK
jgi:hypothetical protein